MPRLTRDTRSPAPPPGGVVADAAAQLDVDVELAHDVGEQLTVAPPAERGVEVDQVDPLRPCLLPGQRGRPRVAVGRLGSGSALHEADRLAVGDVDGGQQLQAWLGDMARNSTGSEAC